MKWDEICQGPSTGPGIQETPALRSVAPVIILLMLCTPLPPPAPLRRHRFGQGFPRYTTFATEAVLAAGVPPDLRRTAQIPHLKLLNCFIGKEKNKT